MPSVYAKDNQKHFPNHKTNNKLVNDFQVWFIALKVNARQEKKKKKEKNGETISPFHNDRDFLLQTEHIM